MSKWFLFLYDFLARRKPWLYGVTVTIFILALFFASRIHFEEDITRFIPDDGDMKTSNAVFRNIKVKDRLTIHLRLADNTARPDLLISYCDSLTRRLVSLVPSYIQEITVHTPEDMTDNIYGLVYGNLPVFLQAEDYVTIDSLLRRETVDKCLQNNYNVLKGPGGFALRGFISDDPLHIAAMALKRLQQMQPNGQFDNYRRHFFTSDHKHLLFFLVPANNGIESANNALMIDALDEYIAHLQAVFPEVTADYYGGPAISVCNARQIKRDTMITLNIALLVIVLFVVVSFRSKRVPLLMLLPVAFGAAISLMMMYFFKGTVSSITVGAGSVIVGIALNYSMHVISHFRHAASPREVVAHLASPLTLGSFTTVGAFSGLTFAKSEALADFGLFAAFCLTGSALFCLIVLPHLLSHCQSGTNGNSRLLANIERIASCHPEKSTALLAVMAGITVASLFFANRTSFDSDMMNLNYVSDRLKLAEHDLQAVLSDSASQTVSLVSTGRDLQEAEQRHLYNTDIIRKLQGEGIIESYASADVLLLPETEQMLRIARWRNFWTEERKTALNRYLHEEGIKYGFRKSAFEPFLELVDDSFHPINVIDSMWGIQSVLPEWLTQTDSLSMILCHIRIPQGQKEKVYEQLDEINNLVIFDRSYFARKFLHIISGDFYLILFISSLIVFITLWAACGRIELTLMTFAPMVLSWVWITGIMGIFGIQFNIINVVISTFIFGLGDDYSIFITDGLTEEYRSGEKTLPAHKTAIFMSAFAMIVGTGSLIFARHPALTSIAVVSTTGMFSVVMAAYTVQPFLFRLFISGRNRQGKYPHTLSSLFFTVYAFACFSMGSILLSFISILLKIIIPIPARKRKYCLHWLMGKLARSTLYCYPSVKKLFSNPAKEDFKRPAVIIANHQSVLDILCLLSLHPKIVMLVNSWVWNSPVFGILVRNAGFYHVKDGYEQCMPALQSMVAAGYSIAVFPEGSRSTDGKIRRFHNGAFYLARQFGLDIIPVSLYGNNWIMPKNDSFYLRKGWIMMEIQPRIAYHRLKQHTDHENARHACGLMRQRHVEMERQCKVPENPYFKQCLITGFLYKGSALEWFLRLTLRKEQNYTALDRIIPREAVITDLGCGYGFLSCMLSFLSENRFITGIDCDEEKISIAKHCFSKSQQLRFICADVTGYAIPKSDVFILNGLLHYFSSEQQQYLLSQCARQLNPGGIIIISDTGQNRKREHRFIRIAETCLARIIKYDEPANRFNVLSDEDFRKFAGRNGYSVKSTGSEKTSSVIHCLQSR